jgi:NADP-dependent 3-hydroxy acid dehydrogenase YdfG
MTVVPVDVNDRRRRRGRQPGSRRSGEIDMVVYNAGFWDRMDATAWDRDLFARHVEVNLLGSTTASAPCCPR